MSLEQLISASRAQFRTVEELVASVIRNAIASGLFEPGEHLSQDRLAKLFDVSRMPIRSVLRQLESEGLVELHAHRGATVRSLSQEEISDLYEMRILVETFALRKTVAAIAESELAELTKLAERLETVAAEEGWLEARRRFYRTLYSIGNTPRVVSTIMQFRAEVTRYTSALADIRAHTHRDLLERVRLRDPDLAAAWLESHLREVARELRKRTVVRATEGDETAPEDSEPRTQEGVTT
jgi:DNA-binding GntR family transcriptional regulator